MTPGRVGEAMAAAGTACLKNAILHVDWNQASIDSNRVCRDGDSPGEYVQWNPVEFALLHDWNAILVPDGMDFEQILAAQRRSRAMPNDQPTAIVYRTRKGWQYGVEAGPPTAPATACVRMGSSRPSRRSSTKRRRSFPAATAPTSAVKRGENRMSSKHASGKR